MTDRSSINAAGPGRDPRKHARLLDTAAREFARVGFDRANVETIAGRAGVAKGTVYLYFDSKTSLFLAVLDELRRRLEEILRSAPRDGDELRRFVRAHLVLSGEAPDLFRCYTSALFGVNRDFQDAALRIFDWQTDELRRLLARGRGARSRDRAALAAGSVLAAALIRGLRPTRSRDTRLEEDVILRGIEAAP